MLQPSLSFSFSLAHTYILTLAFISFSSLFPYVCFLLYLSLPVSSVPSFSLILFHSFLCKSFFPSSFIFNLSLANFYEEFLSSSFLRPSFVLTSSYNLFPSPSFACHLSLVSSLVLYSSLSLSPSPSLSPSFSHYLYFPLSSTRTRSLLCVPARSFQSSLPPVLPYPSLSYPSCLLTR